MSMTRHCPVPAAVAVLAVSCLALAAEELCLSESFETSGYVPWRHTWGPCERTRDVVHSGRWAAKETLEDRHGLSVWYLDIPAFPGAAYRASAWVHVPEQDHDVQPALAFANVRWNRLAGATTTTVGEWVRLDIEFVNHTLSTLRLALYQEGQKPGRGGAVMYWDDVTIKRQLPDWRAKEGMEMNPFVVEGLEVTPAGGMALTVAPGKIRVGDRMVSVDGPVTLELPPPRVVAVNDEMYAALSEDEPRGYGHGTALRSCIARGTTLAGVLDADSLVLKSDRGPEAHQLAEGVDWRADRVWGRIGRLPEGVLGPRTPVFADYRYSLMRIDTIQVRSNGAVTVRTGAEHKMVPEPPATDMGAQALCNLFLPYHCRALEPDHIYPVGPAFPTPLQPELERKAALIPRTRGKLDQGRPVTIVYWGDSVTCGGDASSPETAFPLAFTLWLRGRYPRADIRHVNAGTGGWNSKRKLPLFQEEVLAHRPDLVVIEFVNDMGFNEETIDTVYSEVLQRVRAIGGEVIVLTPHFTRPDWMGAAEGMRTPEIRPAVGVLKAFCERNRVGLADASRRWEHLWIEGIPYITMLLNGINHPDDRGHALFVEELKMFFLSAPPTAAAPKPVNMPPARTD